MRGSANSFVAGGRHEWINEVGAHTTNESEGRYTCTPPAPVLPQPRQLTCVPPSVHSLDYQCQCSKCYGGADGGNPGAVDRFGDWDRAEGAGELASLILCIHVLLLHVNRSILHSSHSVAQ